MGGTGIKDVRGAVFAGSSPPFLGRERAAVDVDVGPERRSPRYHETCLALESVKESSAAVLEPRCVWLRVLIFKDLEKARRQSPGARGGKAGAAARSGSAQKCWRWPARNPAEVGGGEGGFY